MSESINRQLMNVNLRLIHTEPKMCESQPMVDDDDKWVAQEISRIKMQTGLSVMGLGNLAGVSGSAADKWTKTGRITDRYLRALCKGVKENYPGVDADFYRIRHRATKEELERRPNTGHKLATSIYDGLGPRDRATWIKIGEDLITSSVKAKGIGIVPPQRKRKGK